MKLTKKRITDILVITAGSLLYSAGVFFFMAPSKLAIASISGLAVVLNDFIPLSVGTLTLIMCLFCLVLSWFFVGREFTVLTIWPSVLIPAAVRVLEILLPDYTSVMGEPFADMVCFLLLSGLGSAMMFVRNCSSGGLDVIVKIMSKYLHMEIGTAMSIIGPVISVPAIFVYGPKIGILSVVGTYLSGIVLDHFIFGFSQKKRICIVSVRYEEILDHIINDLHSGATLYDATGAYDGRLYREIVVLVNKHEYSDLMNFITRVDPNAFVTISNVSAVINHTWEKKGQPAA